MGSDCEMEVYDIERNHLVLSLYKLRSGMIAF